MEIFIDKPDILLKQIWNDKNIHIVENQYAFGKDKFCLIDISLSADGQDEDKMYADSLFYRKNIRRGNTLVQLYNQKGKQKKKLQWGRKGTQKMIDIRLQYLESITRGINLKKQQKKGFEVIFRNVCKSLQNGKRVQILKTQKANGQNAQVSYFYNLDSWIICSKNVSIMASRIQDLQMYQGKRYTYAKVIATQWFKQIQDLNKEKIKKLKKLLDGYTLVGQYCGNPQYQHLITYDQVKIIWFALIDNFSQQYCIDPFEVKKDIQEFGLRFVKIKRLGSYNDKKAFFNSLENIYLKIAEASMEDKQYGQEGSVVYFICPQMKGNKLSTKVLGSGKLKTIQYRFFRKIRQKLSRYLNKKQSQADLLQKYQNECQQLQKANATTAPYPLNYYDQILQKGCQLIRQTKISESYLRSKFVTILKLLFYVLYQNISLKKYGNQMLDNEKFLEQVTKIPLLHYGSFGCNTKVIYFPITLPKIEQRNFQQIFSQHFTKLNLPFKTIKYEKQDKVTKIYQQINDFTVQNKRPYLCHFYINQTVQMSQIIKILQYLRYKGKRSVYYKFLLITDKITSQNQKLFQDKQFQYPFRKKTIFMSYYNTYLQVKNCPTIQQKINELKKVTKVLLKWDRFLQVFSKNSIQNYEFPFSDKVDIQQNQINQIQKIICDIIYSSNNQKKQYQNYCKMLIRLQKLPQQNFKYLQEQQVNNQVKKIIKSNFYQIPKLDFLK